MIDRSKHNAEDFLIDNSFQLYCAGKDATCVNYWENWLKEHPEKAETIIEAKRIYALLSGNKKPLANQMSQLADKIEYPTPNKKLWTNWKFLSAAASIIVICAVSLYFFNGNAKPTTKFDTEFITAKGEKKTIKLMDGSTVILNASSHLKLNQDFNDKNRQVFLEGEAFFDVAHDKNKPFKVHTNRFDINVLGTVFNVKAYPNEKFAETTLIKGLITMQTSDGKNGLITLKPSQKITVAEPSETKNDRKLLKQKFTIPEISINHYTLLKDTTIVETAWTNNQLQIYDQNFEELRRTLERWYNVEISFKDAALKNYHFTARFENESIDQVLNALKKVEQFNYTINGNQITISK